MSRGLLHRPARLVPEQLPTGALSLAPIPRPPARNQSAGGWAMIALPLLSSLTMAGYMISYGRPILIVLGVSFVLLSVVTTITLRWQSGKSRRLDRDVARANYLAHLSEIRQRVRDTARTQHRVNLAHHPDPERLLSLTARRRRVWERRPGDADFLKLRIGFGTGQLCTPVSSGGRGEPAGPHDRVALEATERFVAETSALPVTPVWVDFASAGVVSILAEPDLGRRLARSLISQLATLHGPAEVALVIAAGTADEAALAEWEWAGWLPHTRAPYANGVSVPMVAADLRDLEDSLVALLAANQQPGFDAGSRPAHASLTTGQPGAGPRHLVVVLDRYDPHAEWARRALLQSMLAMAGPNLKVHLVCLVSRRVDEPSRVDVRAVMDAAGALTLETSDPRLASATAQAEPDLMPASMAEILARRLAPLVQNGEPITAPRASVNLLDVLGIPDAAAFDPAARSVTPDSADVLRVPLGVDTDGDPVLLDLKEAAQGGMGPHGLIVGATGSGKSELLRTLVTGLLATHSPELLSLVLVDFKGGATFAGLTDLPHVGGLITNLADDLAMVDRMRAALIGEQQRRQQLLRQAGDVDSVREYQLRHAAGLRDRDGQPLEPLPHLVLIVDEFGELLTQRPDFADLFVQIGRVGRSLGIHLLLASQRVEEGRLRGLESHLSYRLALRTFSAAESRAVLGTPDAYFLPPQPGSAYLKVHESTYTRFQVAHVSAPYLPDRRLTETALTVTPWELTRRAGLPAPLPEVAPISASDGLAMASIMAVLTDRCRAAGRPVHRVWLAPLPSALPMNTVIAGFEETSDRGVRALSDRTAGTVGAPVAVLDLPLEQRQEAWGIEFDRTAHWALVGAPQTGKSTALRTILLGLAVHHTPDEVQFVAIDMGGGTLQSLERLPHCSGVAGRHEPERARRVLAKVRALLRRREALYRAHAISAVEEARRRRAEGSFPDPAEAADLLLVVDNWAAVRTDVDGAEEALLDIATRGPGVGVHIVLTANRWPDLRTNLRDVFDGRIEFRLNDPTESEVSRHMARLAPAGLPGRVITPREGWGQIVLPRVDADVDPRSLSGAQDDLIRWIDRAWTGTRAPAIRMLPERIDLAEQPPDLVKAGPGLALGIGEDELAVVRVAVDGADQHLAVIGDAGTGKSTALRVLIHGLVEQYNPVEAKIIVVDPRRSLLGAVPASHLSAYAGDQRAVGEYVQQLIEELDRRMPPSTLSVDQLATRSWWEGPEIYLVIDDSDLLEGAASAVRMVVPYLAHAREVGLHVALARRGAGVSRVQIGGGLLAELRDAGAPFLLLSGDSREGVVAHQLRMGEQRAGRGILAQRAGAAQLIQVFDVAGWGSS